MNHDSNHIVTTNFIPVRKEYFLDISKPHLERAMQSHRITRSYCIAGVIITIHWYSSELYQVTSLALDHHELLESTLRDIGDKDHLVIHAWDDTAAGTQVVAPWHHHTFSHEFDAHNKFYGVYVSGEESLSMYDTTTHTGYFWTHDAKRLPGWVPSAPFRTILHWFLSEHAAHLMHGAVIGTDAGSILLTAKGGSGKSTTAISCLLAGMNYLADDYIAITHSPDNTLPQAHSLYQSAKITEHGMQFFPELAEKIWNTDFETRADKREKALFFLKDYFPEQIHRHAPLRAIMIPKITGSETRIVPSSKMAALLAIAPTSLLQLPLAETTKLGAFKHIINHVPCYTLELGPDVRAIPQLIYEFLNNHS